MNVPDAPDTDDPEALQEHIDDLHDELEEKNEIITRFEEQLVALTAETTALKQGLDDALPNGEGDEERTDPFGRSLSMVAMRAAIFALVGAIVTMGAVLLLFASMGLI